MTSYEAHDIDGMHDFTVVTLSGIFIRVEVKTIRNGTKPQVELQKTRAAKGDPSSRYYDRDHFDVVAVCVGRSTGDWSQFRYAWLGSSRANPGDMVLDPFAGSNTTGYVAEGLRRKWVGVEIRNDYAQESQLRFQGAQDDGDLAQGQQVFSFE